MPVSSTSRPTFALFLAGGTLLFSLTACGQSGDATVAETSSSSASVSATPTVSAAPSPSPEPTTAEPTEESPAASQEPTEEPSSSPSVAKLEASDDEQKAMFASEEDLAQMTAASEASLRSRGIDPNDEYVKYGEVLCQGEAFPSSDDLRSVGASEAFISWYAKYVSEAPQHVVEMSNGNRAVEEQGAEAPAIDTAKCTEYGLIQG